MKPKNQNLPVFNQTLDGDEEINIIYSKKGCDGEFMATYLTLVAEVEKSQIFACRVESKEYKHNKKTIIMDFIEMRMGMPMVGFTIRKTGNKIEVVEKSLCFPIDEEDEEQIKDLVLEIAEKLDPTKLDVFEPQPLVP
jgi:hypothetical protein